MIAMHSLSENRDFLYIERNCSFKHLSSYHHSSMVIWVFAVGGAAVRLWTW